MTQWHTPLWISALCLITACGSSVRSEARFTAIATPESSSSEQVQSATSSSGEQSHPLANPSLPPAIAQTPTQDTTIVPGERVGPITKDTSRADLARMFGEAALEDTQIPVGEGFAESGTIVNGGTDQAFSVIWLDQTQSKPLIVRDFGPAWTTPEGIGVGMPLAELQALLGSFKFYGFGWDYGGTIVLEESNLSQYYGLLILRMEPAPGAAQEHPTAYQAIQGDGLFSSDDPNLPALSPSLSGMIVYLNSLLS